MSATAAGVVTMELNGGDGSIGSKDLAAAPHLCR